MTKEIRVIGMISVALVALVAAIVSYTHMQIVAERAGQSWKSWLEPLSVDGLLVGASLVVYVNRRSAPAWLAIVAGLLVSLAANLAAAEPTLISRLVSAWPAVALALSYETLLTLVRHPITDTVVEPATQLIEPTPVYDALTQSEPDQQPEPAPTNGFTFGDANAWARIASGTRS